MDNKLIFSTRECKGFTSVSREPWSIKLHWIFWVCFLLITSIYSATAKANSAPSTTRPYYATADGYTRGSPYASSVNNGTSLKVKTSVASKTYRSFIKFPDIECDDSISCSVKLRLFARSSGKTTLKVYSTSNSWSESSLKWNNAPSSISKLNSYSLPKKNDFYISMNLDGYYQNNLSGQHSFVLIGSSTVNKLLNMHSRSASISASKKAHLSVSSYYLAQQFTQGVSQTTTINPVVFYDADGDSLALTLQGLPDGLSYNSATSTISGTPSNAAVGTHSITVTADDGNGGSKSTTFDLSVENVNDPPVQNLPLVDQTATLDEAFSFVVSENTFTDPDTFDTLSLTTSSTLPSWLSYDALNRELSGTPTALDATGFTITLRATDDSNTPDPGAYAEASFTLSVEPDIEGLLSSLPTTAPTLQAIGIVDATADNEDQYNTAITDASPQPTTLAELQTIVSRVNAMARLLAAAKALNDQTTAEQIEFSSALSVLDGIPAVPDDLMAKLARLIDIAAPQPSHALEIAELVEELLYRATYHPVIWLSMQQGGTPVHRIRPDGGLVQISANLSNPTPGVSASYDWSATDSNLLALSSDPNPITSVLTIDPSALSTEESQQIQLRVSRNGLIADARIAVFTTAEQSNNSDFYDSDNDGIVDQYEGVLEASTNPSAAHKLQSFRGNDFSFYLESNEGLSLRLGEIARATLKFQSIITLEDLIQHIPTMTAAQVSLGLPENNGFAETVIFDFEIVALPRAAASALLVIPLQEPLHRDSRYMKFHPATGWTDFVEDSLNSLSSAPALANLTGICPPAGHDVYSQGLTEGHLCIELTIEDGGPNDADTMNEDGTPSSDVGVNGNIVDPGAVTYQNRGELNSGETNNGETTHQVSTGMQGYGSIGFAWIALLPMLRRRPKITRPQIL